MENKVEAALTDARGENSPERKRLQTALAVFIAAMVLIVPGAVAYFSGLKDTVSRAIAGEDIVELGRQEVAKSIEQRLYWGGLVASANPALTSREINEIGRAILQYSRAYGLQPKLVVAIIMAESGGRRSAVSPIGAQGLMQVMPFWKKELGINGTLFDIDNNIRAGCHILAENMRRWGYKEGILRYYRGDLPVSGEHYFVRVQDIMGSLS